MNEPASWARRSAVVVVVVLAVSAAIGASLMVRDEDGEAPLTAGTTSSCTSAASSTSATTDPPSSVPLDPSITPTTSTTATPTTEPGGPSVLVRRISTSEPAVALTFDAGSDAGSTAQILDLLAARGVTASFGLTGRWVEQNPQLAVRIVDEGHTVLNHTRDHLSFTGRSTDTLPLSSAERTEQILGAESAIRSVAGGDPRPWFRPPYGDYDDTVLRDVGRAGYRYSVLWSLDSLGWKGIPAEDVADRVIGGLEPGAIILLHVGAASTDVDALPAVLDAVEACGLRAVSLDELAA